MSVFSLPTQRCFYQGINQEEKQSLFSAYAEVFPSMFGVDFPTPSFLCLRRGVSRCVCASRFANGFSLPTQRCFPGDNSHCL